MSRPSSETAELLLELTRCKYSEQIQLALYHCNWDLLLAFVRHEDVKGLPVVPAVFATLAAFEIRLLKLPVDPAQCMHSIRACTATGTLLSLVLAGGDVSSACSLLPALLEAGRASPWLLGRYIQVYDNSGRHALFARAQLSNITKDDSTRLDKWLQDVWSVLELPTRVALLSRRDVSQQVASICCVTLCFCHHVDSHGCL